MGMINKIRESDTLPVGTPVEATNYATSSNLSTIDLLARTLYVESIEDENASAMGCMDNNESRFLEMAKGDWTYDIVIDYEARKVVPGTKSRYGSNFKKCCAYLCNIPV